MSRRSPRGPPTQAVAPRPKHGRGRQLDALVQLTLVHLAHRTLRTRRTSGAGSTAHSLVRPLPDALLAVETDDLVAAHGIVPARLRRPSALRRCANRMRWPTPEPPIRSTPPDPAPDTIWRSPDSVELATFHPAPTAPTRQASGTRAAFEKHLVEVDLTAHVTQRAHLDARLVEIDEEVRQPLALGHVDVGPGQEHGPVREVRPRGPHLLTGDDPVIAVTLGPGGQGGKVRTGARLAEELAPGLLVADDRREKSKSLLLGPVREQGGRRQVESERVQTTQVERAELLLDPPGGLP